MDPLNPQDDYEVPKADSKYVKFEEGQTEFMPLASAIIGWEYWTEEGKPVRVSEEPTKTPADIRVKDGQPEKIKHFWAFPVWDYTDSKVKVLEITQKTIMNIIRSTTTNPKWGSPVCRYSFTVGRTGDGLNTEYTCVPNPIEISLDDTIIEAWEEAQANGFDITRLFVGGDPFSPEVK